MKVMITGAPGSGTSTLGAALAGSRQWRHLETDAYQWLDSKSPFERKTDAAQRRQRLLADLQRGDAVVSGSLVGWGSEVEDGFDLIVFLQLDSALRIERIIARDTRLYGAPDPRFIEWAATYDGGGRAGRSRLAHETWLAARGCPILRLEGPMPVEDQLDRIEEILNGLPRQDDRRDQAGHACKGGFEAFLEAMLAMEAGLSPMLFDWYIANLDRPVIDYPSVDRPGRPLRDAMTGRLVTDRMTVRRYFEALGVADHFNSADPSCIKRMQYRAINALGFVGYQFGEAVLSETGHYELSLEDHAQGGELRRTRVCYMGGIADDAWRQGCRRVEVDDGQGHLMLAADVNEWRGRFTGKDGVHSLEDLRGPAQQERVMRAVLALNHATLNALLKTATPRPSAARFTTSGLLAAAHLCGARATASYLAQGRVAVDEFGTSMTSYLAQFSNYELPFADLVGAPSRDPAPRRGGA